MKSSVLLAATVTLAPYATAQSWPTWSHSHTSDWNSTTVGTGGPITRLVAGEVTGGAQLDVLALGGSGGTQLLLLDAVESNTAMLLYGATVRDFDLAPKDATTGRQELVYVDATGLWRTGWVDGTGFGSPTLVTTPAAQPWAQARKVRCGLVDATAGVDYVGLSMNMRRVLYFGGTEWSTLDTGPRVYDVQLADWSGDASLEIVLLTADDVRILDATTSSVIVSYARTYIAGDAIATFRTGSGSFSGVAWLCQASGGGSPSLITLTSAGVLPASLDLADAVALRAGDADNDGWDDLIFARSNAIAPSYLRNSGTCDPECVSSFTAATRSIAVADPGIAPPTVPGVAPLLTDLNNDGLADVLAAVGGTSAAALVLMVADYTPLEPPADPPGGGLSQYPAGGGAALNAEPTPGFFPRCGGVLEGGAFEYGSGSLSWSAYFDVIPAGANHLEVRLWKRKTAVGPNPAYTDPVCQLLRYLPLPAPDPNPDFTFRVVEDIPTTQLSALNPCDERALWIEMRLIEGSGPSGNPSSIVNAWPMYTAVLVGDCAAVANMMPPPDDDTRGMNGTVLASCFAGSGLNCMNVYDVVACLPPDPGGSTPPPMVTIKNKRPLPPGTVPIYPSPVGSGSVTANDAP